MKNKELKLCYDFYGGCEYCPSKIMCADAGKKREELLKIALKKDKNEKR
jgi:hypothetical protein